MSKTVKITGGDKIQKFMKNIKNQSATLEVGWFQEDQATKAARNEFGSIINVEEHEATIYRKIDQSGEFLNNGKFVKKSNSNYATKHKVSAHQIEIPPRPFMQNAINKNSKEWQDKVADLLPLNNYDVLKVFRSLGGFIQADIFDSIENGEYVPNSPSTIAKKGFDKPLTDTGIMKQTLNFDVHK